jgi:transcriptional regulator with XRE-family HTH domain
MQLGKIVTAYRNREDLSIREGAKKLGIAPQAMLRIENGEPVSGENLQAILQSEPVRAAVAKRFKVKAAQWDEILLWLFSEGE